MHSIKGAIFHVSLTLIVLMSSLADLTLHTLQKWELEIIQFFKTSGTVAILYFDNLCHEESIISLCIYGFVYDSDLLSSNYIKI